MNIQLLMDWGFHPIVVEPNGKKPVELNWPKIATRNQAEAEAAFNRYPGHNVGAVTGFGRLVIDVDVKNGQRGAANLAALQKSNGGHLPDLPPTVTTISPSGGKHLWFKSDNKGIKNSASLLCPGVDIKADAGQVLLPPSTVNGNEYKWAPGYSPDEVQMAELPFMWSVHLRMLTAERKQQAVVLPARQCTQAQRDEAFTRAEAMLDLLPRSVAGDNGDTTLFAAACSLARSVLHPDDLLTLLHRYNDACCDPPWDGDRIRYKWGEALKVVSLGEDYWNTFKQGPLPVELNVFKRMYQPWTADDWAKEPPPVEWILEDFIPVLPGAVGTFAGEGGAGKSALILGLLVARAQGKTSFLGMPIKPGKSLFLSGEEDLDNLHRKIKAWFTPDTNLKLHTQNLVAVSHRGVSVKLNEKGRDGLQPHQEVVQYLVEFIKEKCPGVDLVVWETVSRIAADETNESFEMVVSLLEQVATETNTTILVIHHKNKAGTGVLGGVNSIRGGGALKDNGRFNFLLEPLPDKNEARARFLGRNVRNREYTDHVYLLSNVKVNLAWHRHILALEQHKTDYHSPVFVVADPSQVQDIEDEILAAFDPDLIRKIQAAVAEAEKPTVSSISKEYYQEWKVGRDRLKDRIKQLVEAGYLKFHPTERRNNAPVVLVGKEVEAND